MDPMLIVVDDDGPFRASVSRVLRSSYRILEAESAEEALALLEKETPDLVLSDVQMPGMGGLELLRLIRERDPTLAIVMMSGMSSIEVAVKSVQAGALDFLEKPFSPERLKVTVANALRYSRLKEVHERLTADSPAVEKLLGDSRAMQSLRTLILRVGATDGRVLVLGENGSGKELVAAAIHASSERREHPFIKINCAAIPEGLVESELFGHERGAFTGAVSSRKGRFEQAHQGTLMLDEVGELPAAMQAKLLRVLQEGCFERVGGSQTIKVDVRVISATNRDLEAMIDDGTFREDLYYRLNVITLEVPPLRERVEDIPLLAQAFLAKLRERHGRSNLSLAPDALAVLAEHDYRGNVRELQNVVERLVILSEDDLLDADDARSALPRRRQAPASPSSPLPQSPPASPPASSPAASASTFRRGTPLRQLLLEAEKSFIRAAIDANDGNKSSTAKELDVERSHFYKKCKQLEID